MTETYDENSIILMHDGIKQVLHEWCLPANSEIELLNISENATFVATPVSRAEKIIIRVHRPGYHTRQEIESELLWIDSLRNEGIVSTAAIIPTVSEDKIVLIPYGDETRMAVAFEFLQGAEPTQADNLEKAFFTLGCITAKLHNHTKNWRIPVGFKRKYWDFDAMLGETQLWGDWRKAIGLKDEGRDVLSRVADLLQQQLRNYGQDKEHFGLIHADLRLTNLLINDKNLNVIDFDDCGYSWFMYDFAAAVSFMEEEENIPELQNSWVAGYRSAFPLPLEEERALPMFVMLRRVLLTAWLASHAETETAKELGASYTEGTIRLAKKYLNAA
jgi:Ser/Thr protein kinase RdoA (MazF antagonist)